MFFLEFSSFGDQKNMSFLDLMTELKIMFLFFSKSLFWQNMGSTMSRISEKKTKKHEKEALSSDWVPSELITSEVLIL